METEYLNKRIQVTPQEESLGLIPDKIDKCEELTESEMLQLDRWLDRQMERFYE